MINSPIEEIKSKLDIIDVIGGYIKLQKSGRNYKAPCPFHSEKTPSFMVSPEKQLWRCFGCNRGGSIFDFIMEIEGVEFGDALRTLAQRAGVELNKVNPKLAAQWKTERTRLYEICDLTNRFFIKQLESKAGKDIQKYLFSRGLKLKTIKDWEVGYAPNHWQGLLDFLNGRGYSDEEIMKTGLIVKSETGKSKRGYYDRFRDRIIFPIKNINEAVIGFTGRENPNNPDERMGKYINTPNTLIYDKSQVLYGLDKAKLDIRKKNLCILVEGQTDVLMSHQEGFNNIIASSGTALTEHQLKIIKRYTQNLAMAFDMDLAGEIATKRGIDLAIQSGLNVKVINLPNNQDPADCLQKNVSAWSNAVNQAKGFVEFYLESIFVKNDPFTGEGKKIISQEFLPVIRKIPNKVEQAHWLQELAQRIKVSESILMEELKKIKEPIINRPLDYLEDKKDNKECLEEYTIGLILSYPSIFRRQKKKPQNIFNNPDLEKIYKSLKKNKDIKSTKKDLSPQLEKQIDHLIFKIETQRNLVDEFKPKKEIEFCFAQLKKRYLQKKLNQLNLSIKEAENKKDKISLKKLTQDFNKLSKQIIII
ncbi:DNA primase [Patescibacteria group bacterium]|nr:DNA primase [Patescibacteria group bacterium]